MKLFFHTSSLVFLSLIFNFALSPLGFAEDRVRVYVAGPLFNKHEKLAQDEIAKLLESHGFSTFLPQRDGLEMVKVGPSLTNDFKVSKERLKTLLAEVIYSLDVYQVIERCEALVANMNGVVLDDGTVAELTYAAMSGHPVILYRDDVRSHFEGLMNPLVTVAAQSMIDRLESIPDQLKKMVKETQAAASFRPMLPPLAQARVEQGKALWIELEKINSQKLSEKARIFQISTKIMEIFKPEPKAQETPASHSDSALHG